MALRALSTAASGMQAQQTGIDVIAHNLANVNTVGFKRQRADFEDLFYAELKKAGTKDNQNNVVPTGIEVGHGVKLSATPRIFAQGPLKETENELDLAIQGRGFFQVTVLTDQAPGNIGYTRSGNFLVDSQGQVVTQDGFKLIPAITVPPEAVGLTVSIDGVISAILQNQAAPQNLGQIQLTNFINPAGLRAIGDNLYVQTEASGNANNANPGAPGFGLIRQGFLEESNVNVVTELVNLITTQRAYEVNANSIETADQMLRTANNLRR